MLCWMITWNMTEAVDTPVNVTLVVMTSWICGVPNWQCCSATITHSAFFPEFNYSKNSFVTTVINENLTKYTQSDFYIHTSNKNLYNRWVTFSIHRCMILYTPVKYKKNITHILNYLYIYISQAQSCRQWQMHHLAASSAEKQMQTHKVTRPSKTISFFHPLKK